MTRALPHPLGDGRTACTGCAACAVSCERGAITMQADAEGFLHPRINPAVCTRCGRCARICPANPKAPVPETQPEENGQPFPTVFAAWHSNETTRRGSASGGVFAALAENIFASGGVVAGAAFDGDSFVRHILIEKASEIPRLQGSKYVQSEVSPSLYRRIRNHLETDRLVLFTGTPCQVAGLRAYLGTGFPNLWTCDLVCHGVPSPRVFEAYKKLLERRHGGKARKIEFRDKTTGWKRYSVTLSFDNGSTYRRMHKTDPFMTGFLENTYLRPSCHACRFSRLPRIADLTLGDFWGVGVRHPDWDDDKGTSLVLVQSQKGAAFFKSCQDSLVVHEAELGEALRGNPCICRTWPAGERRAAFFRDLDRLPFERVLARHTGPPPLWRRAAGKTRRVLASVIRRLARGVSS